MELRNSGCFSHLWQCHYRRCSSMFHGTKICFKKNNIFQKTRLNHIQNWSNLIVNQPNFVVKPAEKPYCDERDEHIHQRMNANGLLLYDLFSWNKANKTVRYLNTVSWNIVTVYIQNGNYSQKLRTLCMMGPLCHAGLFFPSSLLLNGSVAPSSAGDQLLILLPTWRAGPSPIPPTRVDPISLRVQASSPFFVGYTCYDLEQQLTYTSYSVIIKTYPRTISTTQDLHVKSLVSCIFKSNFSWGGLYHEVGFQLEDLAALKP
jgi:hypothetical protein